MSIFLSLAAAAILSAAVAPAPDEAAMPAVSAAPAPGLASAGAPSLAPAPAAAGRVVPADPLRPDGPPVFAEISVPGEALAHAVTLEAGELYAIRMEAGGSLATPQIAVRRGAVPVAQSAADSDPISARLLLWVSHGGEHTVLALGAADEVGAYSLYIEQIDR